MSEKELNQLRSFYKVVRQMRILQRTYFKTRDKKVLQHSKDQERIVDAFIRERETNRGQESLEL